MANSDPPESLLTRAEAGDHSILPDLLNHCRADMVVRLRRRRHANEAEDIFQNALAEACRRLDKFIYQGWDALQAWLWKFVKRAHADRCKYHARDCRDERRVVADALPAGTDSSQVGVLEGVASREKTPSWQTEQRERDERLRQAMREVLTPEQRLAIELRHFEFRSVEEVARRTGWTKGKVKMLCQRGYEKLHEVLDDSMRSSGAS